LHAKHREKLREIRENNNISDEEYRKLLENDVEIKVKEAALDKEYAPKFERFSRLKNYSKRNKQNATSCRKR